MDPTLNNDIEHIVDFSELFNFINEGDTLFITGGTGLLGSLLTRSLLKYKLISNRNFNITLLVRNENKAKSIFIDENIEFVEGDIINQIYYPKKIDYIIHFAATTSSQAFVKEPVNTINSIVTGTKNILELAKEKNIKSMIFTSSLEIYGTPFSSDIIMKENDSGYLNCTSVRSSYSEGKRIAECLCVAYHQQYNIPVKIARLCQTFGAGVSYYDNRVFAYFSRRIIENKDIILKTKGLTLRNYCYTTDAIRAILLLLEKGTNAEAYNIANKEFNINIIDMANYLIAHFGSNSKIIFDISEPAESIGFNPEMKILLDTQKIENLGWKALINQEESFQRLINYMRNNK